MQVTKLHFKDYRNLHENTIIPDPGINVVYGNNAQGKTNILETIWLFTGNRSFRGVKDVELIKFGKRSLDLSLMFMSQGRRQSASIKISTEDKKTTLNSVDKKSTTAFLGAFNAVVFSPDHLSLVKGNPIERRKFLDLAICQVKPTYAKLLANYNKTLVQRNALLKDIVYHSELLDTLEIWDEKIVVYASKIISERSNYIQQLSKIANNIYLGISSQTESLEIKYISTVMKKDTNGEKEFLAEFLKKLKMNRKDDIKLGFTTIGPHRDDLEILLNQRNTKTFASQGQQRSIVLSIKMAEATILKESTSNYPVVLLDDIMSELDISRQNYILNCIKEWQVFITCCEASTVMRMLKGRAFRVKEGSVYQC